MCGIIGIVSNKPIINELINSLGRLQYRGYDGNGYAVIESGNLVINKDIGYIEELKVDKTLKSTLGLSHCRWGTHGAITKENCHPHSDCGEKLAIVHNGIIDNYEILKDTLIKHGHIFKSETDSEVISHLIEHYSKRHDFKDAFNIAIRCLNFK